MTTVLDKILEDIFKRPGCVLHGSTPLKQRRLLVDQFQKPEGPPYFVLSLKAGGTGLTLTAASHVIHFDRWWNPAVEDQATDRAHRIGQKKNVLVHKLTCGGTVEAKIADLITRKRQLAGQLLTDKLGNSDLLLTELNDEELLALVSLDLSKACCEA
jgi:non-specific serine/threonine protein kinase